MANGYKPLCVPYARMEAGSKNIFLAQIMTHLSIQGQVAGFQALSHVLR